MCTHRACVRTALINEISKATGPEVDLEIPRGIPSGDLGVGSVLPVLPLAVLCLAIESR